MVEFFYKNNLKVVDVALGEYFSLVLTSNGDCWTFGYGGRNTNFVLNLFFTAVGSLGHGDN